MSGLDDPLVQFGLVWLFKQEADEQARQQAREVVEQLDLDPELDAIVPPYPPHERERRIWLRLVNTLARVSSLPDDERRAWIAELRDETRHRRGQ